MQKQNAPAPFGTGAFNILSRSQQNSSYAICRFSAIISALRPSM